MNVTNTASLQRRAICHTRHETHGEFTPVRFVRVSFAAHQLCMYPQRKLSTSSHALLLVVNAGDNLLLRKLLFDRIPGSYQLWLDNRSAYIGSIATALENNELVDARRRADRALAFLPRGDPRRQRITDLMQQYDSRDQLELPDMSLSAPSAQPENPPLVPGERNIDEPGGSPEGSSRESDDEDTQGDSETVGSTPSQSSAQGRRDSQPHFDEPRSRIDSRMLTRQSPPLHGSLSPVAATLYCAQGETRQSRFPSHTPGEI